MELKWLKEDIYIVDYHIPYFKKELEDNKFYGRNVTSIVPKQRVFVLDIPRIGATEYVIFSLKGELLFSTLTCRGLKYCQDYENEIYFE